MSDGREDAARVVTYVSNELAEDMLATPGIIGWVERELERRVQARAQEIAEEEAERLIHGEPGPTPKGLLP